MKNVLDNDGELSLVQSARCGVVNGVTATCSDPQGYFSYAKSFTYNAAGAVTSMQLGNGRWETTQFNSRLQPTQIALGTVQNATDKLKLNYEYGATGLVNNGNVTKQTITVPGLAQPFVQSYTYDELNRIKTATETDNGVQTWTQVYGFDRYGNRNITSGTGVTNLTFNGSNNRITTSGYSYDNAGNTVADPSGKTYTYDAENKQTMVGNGSIGQYFYDGDGRRVKKYVPSTGETTIFVYDAAGKQISEYSTIVASTNDAKVAYLTTDHLGSPRINTDQNGAVIARHDYMPFGEEIFSDARTTTLDYAADTIRKQFTGYERDTETDLDFAQARMYSKSHGRFTSPDNFVNDTHISDPRSWNLYVYVRNNPLMLTDPTGEIIDENSFKATKAPTTVNVFSTTRTTIGKDGKKEVRTVNLSSTATEGTVTCDDGKTKITAFKSEGPLQLTETDANGKVTFSGTIDEYEKVIGTETPFHGWNDVSDCHGTTFANGALWIDNNQVETLMKGDGYDTENPSSTPTAGAVGIYSLDGTLSTVQHSVTVTNMNPTLVRSKGGLRPVETTTPAGAWNNTRADRQNNKLLYYSKKVTTTEKRVTN